MSPLKNGNETEKTIGDKMKKENLKYVWLAIFVIMVCTVITCQGDTNIKESTIEIEKSEEPKEEVDNKEEIVEPEEVPVEEVQVEEVPVEEVKEDEAPIEETPTEKIQTDWIPPVDTLERKEYYDENNWKYDDTIPQEKEDGQD